MTNFTRTSRFERFQGAALYRAVTELHRTIRLRTVVRTEAEDVIHKSSSLIFAGWHGEMLASLGIYKRLRLQADRSVLIIRDDSRGRILADAAARLGFQPISIGTIPGPGAWTRGIVRLIRLLKGGRTHALIAVDGPEGPAKQVHAGIGLIAQETGVPIIPTLITASHYMRLRRRWDNLLIPLPFSRVSAMIGAPILPESLKGATASEITALLSQRLENAQIAAHEHQGLKQPTDSNE